MKFFVVFAVACLLASASADDKDDKIVGSSYGGGYAQPAAAPAAAAYAAPAPAPAAAAYAAPAPAAYAAPAPAAYAGQVSIPAPPCPKNYLFSCQPNLAPVPCSAPAASYGPSGAYSQYAPVYAPRPLQW